MPGSGPSHPHDGPVLGPPRSRLGSRAARRSPRSRSLSARRALEIDSQSPEAYNLLGYVCALKAEYEEAIENYRQAIALDDTYPRSDAERGRGVTFTHSASSMKRAVDVRSGARSRGDRRRGRRLLVAQVRRAARQGEIDEARELCSSFPQGPFENPAHIFLVGRAFYEIGDADRAFPPWKAVKRNPKNPEAWYYLGLVRDERAQTADATVAFLRARAKLDLEVPARRPGRSRTRPSESTVLRADRRLLESLKVYVREGEVYARDVPGGEVVVDGVDLRALLMLDGISTRCSHRAHRRARVRLPAATWSTSRSALGERGGGGVPPRSRREITAIVPRTRARIARSSPGSFN